MRILITGASGFVGSNLLKALIKNNHEITVVTSVGVENPIPNGINKVCYLGLEGLNWEYVHGQDIVIHQAANNDTLFNDKKEMYRANVFGPMKLFNEAFIGGCKNFIYASSTAVYGNQPAPFIENETSMDPLNLYGRSKAEFDNFALNFALEKEVNVIGLRYCNIYGPGESHKGKRASMIYQLIQEINKTGKATLFKDGEQKRDWIYIDDVVNANIGAMNTLLEKNISGIYNCGTGISTTFNQIVKLIDNDAEINYISNPYEESFQNHTECNIKKMREELNFSPHFNVELGIKTYKKELTIC